MKDRAESLREAIMDKMCQWMDQADAGDNKAEEKQNKAVAHIEDVAKKREEKKE